MCVVCGNILIWYSRWEKSIYTKTKEYNRKEIPMCVISRNSLIWYMLWYMYMLKVYDIPFNKSIPNDVIRFRFMTFSPFGLPPFRITPLVSSCALSLRKTCMNFWIVVVPEVPFCILRERIASCEASTYLSSSSSEWILFFYRAETTEEAWTHVCEYFRYKFNTMFGVLIVVRRFKKNLLSALLCRRYFTGYKLYRELCVWWLICCSCCYNLTVRFKLGCGDRAEGV